MIMEISDDYSNLIKRGSNEDQTRIRTAFEDLKQGWGKYKERLQYKCVYSSIRIVFLVQCRLALKIEFCKNR